MDRPRPTTRDEQRKLTRRRIIDAARKCFYEQGVADVSVEQIARVAAVGRATLYLHFPNKDAILLDLLSLDMIAVRKIFAKLFALDPFTLAAVQDWLANYIQTLGAHRDAMRLAHTGVAITDAARTLLHDHHEALAAMMAARFPALIDGTERSRVRLMLMLARLDHFADAAAEEPPRLDPAAGIDLVSRELIALVEGAPS
ncbi:hypothetical protein BH10PSE13_BH10PSE13_10800 [soil metagenome]